MIQRFIITLLFTGVPFGLFMGLFFTLQYGFSLGLWLGLISGVLFGLAMSIFVEVQHRRMASPNGVFNGEEIFLQGPANHFMNGEGRGGWLTLTPTRLVFRGHGMNIQNNDVTIGLAEIESARPVTTLGIIPNGLEIVRKNGRHERFVVRGRRRWIAYITETLDTHSYRSVHFSP
ncbi:MAG: hypothetical protein AAGF95_02535 [Chloroflexota bacterium]